MQNQIQSEKQRIQTEFNQLRSILDSEEQRELQKLEEEETKTLHDLAEAENELVQQSQLLEELISDLELRSEWSALELLQVKRVTQSEILKTPSNLAALLCPGALILVLTLKGSFDLVEHLRIKSTEREEKNHETQKGQDLRCQIHL